MCLHSDLRGSYWGVWKVVSEALALPDAEDLGTTPGTGALGSRTAILEGDLFGTTDLSLGPALKTVCLHWFTSLGSK